jgi:hypothetical protein
VSATKNSPPAINLAEIATKTIKEKHIVKNLPPAKTTQGRAEEVEASGHIKEAVAGVELLPSQ